MQFRVLFWGKHGEPDGAGRWFIHDAQSPPNQCSYCGMIKQKKKCRLGNIFSSGHLLISFLCPFKWLLRWKWAPLTMRTARIPTVSVFFFFLFLCQLIQLKSLSLSYQHFGTTFCITLGSLPLPRLISGLYYTVLDILFWRKLHKRRGGGGF